MTFNLRVRFTGGCAFVPDRPFKNEPKQVMVVIPDGESQSSGLDSKGLNRHRAFVRFNLRDVIGMPKVPKSTQGIWDLGRKPRTKLGRARGEGASPSPPEGWEGDRGDAGGDPIDASRRPPPPHRSAFHPSGSPQAVAAEQKKLVQTRLTLSVKGGPSNLTIGDVARLADMGPIVDGYYSIDPDATSWKPPKSVLAQFVIEKGRLYTGGYQGTWVFPKYLCKENVVIEEMSNEVILDVKKVAEATLIAKPLSGGGAKRLCLAPGTGRWVEITVANLCDNNPLEWPVDTGTAQPDQDFRWFFELLSEPDRQELGDIIKGLYLPHPWPQPDDNGQGMDCFPTSFQPAKSRATAGVGGERGSTSPRRYAKGGLDAP
ncbi:MAG TPA: hypothetical protein VHR45_18390 [Thermoanaerobaculia bacterium]|nr:hypothetical protein [Thermoanaerobaculia bacterium]